MNSRTSDEFWRRYSALPAEVRKQARKAYALFVQDPYHPSLHFKRIHSTRPVFSIRIGSRYRAVGNSRGNRITWFWIGTHANYDKLVAMLRTG
jgi:hypothetical protein